MDNIESKTNLESQTNLETNSQTNLKTNSKTQTNLKTNLKTNSKTNSKTEEDFMNISQTNQNSQTNEDFMNISQTNQNSQTNEDYMNNSQTNDLKTNEDYMNNSQTNQNSQTEEYFMNISQTNQNENNENNQNENNENNENENNENNENNQNENENQKSLPFFVSHFLDCLQIVLEKDSFANTIYFNQNELQIIKNFIQNTSLNEKKIYLRLFARKNLLFRFSEIQQRYSQEIDSSTPLKSILQNLKTQKLFLDNKNKSNISSEQMCQYLKKKDLIEVIQKSAISSPKLSPSKLNASNKKNLKKMILDSIQKQQSNKSFQMTLFGQPILTKNILLSVFGDFVQLDPSKKEIFQRVLFVIFLNDNTSSFSFYSSSSNSNSNSISNSISSDSNSFFPLQETKYPNYKIIKKTPLFQSRQDLLDYIQAREIYLQFHSALYEESELSKQSAFDIFETALSFISDFAHNEQKLNNFISLPQYMQNFSQFWIYIKILTKGIPEFLQKKRNSKKEKQILKLLLSLNFNHPLRNEWFDRITILFNTHLKSKAKAQTWCQKALNDKYLNNLFRFKIERRLTRVQSSPKRKKDEKQEKDDQEEQQLQLSFNLPKEKIIYAKPFRSPKPTSRFAKRLYFSETNPDEILTVEEFALEHYIMEKYYENCVHTETSLWKMLFVVLLWQEIYETQVPDVFQTPYQTYPLDLFTTDFYKNRKTQIDQKLAQISQMNTQELNQYFSLKWESHYGTACIAVSWEKFDFSILLDILACLGGLRLSKILRYFAIDFKLHSSGMPDLCSWSSVKQEFENICLIEVKSQNDRLSDIQKYWITILQKCGVYVEICRVLDFDEKEQKNQ
ncbi:fanconi-associated nuclease 1 [Anaeramoeba ignava]|uniref:Fanconi-associated nuclease n=1 Tax=Anaeramoeba ignava TaxID=1746090 RepID=A0A9Q0RFI6_ANAIG|nr:fanconi-associated nuclease 1 [Anaeramoeba ignava]